MTTTINLNIHGQTWFKTFLPTFQNKLGCFFKWKTIWALSNILEQGGNLHEWSNFLASTPNQNYVRNLSCEERSSLFCRIVSMVLKSLGSLTTGQTLYFQFKIAKLIEKHFLKPAWCQQQTILRQSYEQTSLLGASN